jgi:dihydrodipicolinate synthase/N-acetylneuraminate lyase
MSTPTLARPLVAGPSTVAPTAARLLIVATDWDKELRAASYAVERARHADAVRVDVVYASPPIVAWQVLRFWAHARVLSWQREQGDRLLHAYRERLAEQRIAATGHVRIDDPAKAITRLAREIGAECVVLPTPPATELPPFGYWRDVHKLIRQSGTPVVLA